jgi:hypothetical protein
MRCMKGRSSPFELSVVVEEVSSSGLRPRAEGRRVTG